MMDFSSKPASQPKAGPAGDQPAEASPADAGNIGTESSSPSRNLSDLQSLFFQIGTHTLEEGMATPPSHQRVSIPPELVTSQPARWECYQIPDSPPAAITHLHEHILSAKARFAAASPGKNRYEVMYGAIATFSDGSHSSVSLNIPPITEVNRCAESGLVAHIEGQAALGEEHPTIERITLIGFPLGDESSGFSTHPNPCARCRDRLQVLASLGTIDGDTEILILALNRDGTLPRGGRLTSYGDLLVSTSGRESDGEGSISSQNRAATISAVIEEMQGHFRGIPLDSQGLSVRMARVFRSLQRGRETFVAAGISPDGKLEVAVARPSMIVSRGKVHRFSAETGGLVTALVEGWEKPFFLNVSGRRRPSSVTMQRFLDVMHHVHAKEESEQIKILQVSPVSLGSGRFVIDTIDPRREFPLGEGPIHRGRRGLIEDHSGQIRFSSKLGVPREVVARLVERVQVERLSSTADGDSLTYSLKTKGEKVRQVEKMLGGPLKEEPHLYSRVTRSVHFDQTGEKRDGSGKDYAEQVANRLVQLLDGAEKLHKRIHPRGETRYPLCAVVGTRDSGELVQPFEFVSPFPTGFEEHGVDPLIQALAELLLVASPDNAPDELHVAWRGGEPGWGEEHEVLMAAVRGIVQKKVRLALHRDV